MFNPKSTAMYLFSFEKLDVWKRSRVFVKEIYKLSARFPKEEKFGMTSQIRSAAVSVPTNLAEGIARKTPRDQSNFTTMSFSSLMEVLNLLIISADLNIIEESEYQEIRPLIEEISNKLNALRNSQKVKN
jgi:four helix bundle protein